MSRLRGFIPAWIPGIFGGEGVSKKNRFVALDEAKPADGEEEIEVADELPSADGEEAPAPEPEAVASLPAAPEPEAVVEKKDPILIAMKHSSPYVTCIGLGEPVRPFTRDRSGFFLVPDDLVDQATERGLSRIG